MVIDEGYLGLDTLTQGVILAQKRAKGAESGSS